MIVPHGRTADAAYPAQVTGPLLDLLEDYFGTPYPFPKLDLVAVSVFNAGAMENPGFITFRQELILTKPGERTLNREKSYATVVAHEMAHQWFGDLVTLAWWDDTWLNEIVRGVDGGEDRREVEARVGPRRRRGELEVGRHALRQPRQRAHDPAADRERE